MFRINKKQQELIKAYVFLFILLFTIINWDTVSWIFNYREISGLVYDFFTPYPDSRLLVSASEIKLPPAMVGQNSVVNTAKYPYSKNPNSLEIPGIGLLTDLIIGQSTDIPTLERDLDKGVVYYPGSVLPGQNGQIVVLGHSAPPNWPHIKHDWVFSDINNLKSGDTIVLYFNNRQYTYKVIEKSIIKRGQDVGSFGLTGKNNVLTIVSCWPPGKDYQRIAVSAELVS